MSVSTDFFLHQLSESVVQARTLESLARPLLELLQECSELESSYLTVIDLTRSEQQVLYAHNTATLVIPEGVTVPWDDTLCRRALDAGHLYTADVPERWADSQAARVLGIQTYVSQPVQFSDGRLYGTLCAASASVRPLPRLVPSLLRLFASLIAQQVEREQLIEELQQKNLALATFALTDTLTGLPNRRAVHRELARLLAQARRTQTTVLVGFADLDGFKQINDLHGHAAGDQLLRKIARRLQQCLREADLAARFSGDEFVLMGPGPAGLDAGRQAAQQLQARITEATTGRVSLGPGLELDYPGASVGVVCLDPLDSTVEAALQAADQAMYRVKARRRRGERRPHPPIQPAA